MTEQPWKLSGCFIAYRFNVSDVDLSNTSMTSWLIKGCMVFLLHHPSWVTPLVQTDGSRRGWGNSPRVPMHLFITPDTRWLKLETLGLSWPPPLYSKRHELPCTGQFTLLPLKSLKGSGTHFQGSEKSANIAFIYFRRVPMFLVFSVWPDGGHTNPGTMKPHTWHLRQHEFGVVYPVWIHSSIRIRYCDLHLLITS